MSRMHQLGCQWLTPSQVYPSAWIGSRSRPQADLLGGELRHES